MTEPSHTVLIVDDSVTVRRLVVGFLGREQCRVVEAENGLVGYELALREKPDLAICDITMPVLDGWGFVDKVRNDERLDTLPILMLTRQGDRGSVRRAMACGADDFLVKPWSGEELVEAVRGLLAKSSCHRADTERSMAQLRSAVLGTVPHELRTPLTSILGLSKLLLQRRGQFAEDRVYGMVDRIHHSAERLTRTITRMMAWAALSAAAKDAPVPAPALAVGEAVAAMLADEGFRQELAAMLPGREMASSGSTHQIAGHVIRTVLEPADILCAPDDLRRMLGELLGNALRFSSPGMPVGLTGRWAGAGHYRLEMANMGQPIPADFLDRIGALSQADRAQHEQQGIGLGLAMTQMMARRNGAVLEIARYDGSPTILRLTFGAQACAVPVAQPGTPAG